MAYENKIEEALHYQNINRYEKSNEALYEALAYCPNDGFALHMIGKNHFYLFNYEEAIKFCKESLEHGYSIEVNSGLMGTIYMGMEDYIQSEKCYLEALQINPHDARVLAAYGLLMLQTHHTNKAVQLLEEAMKLNPHDEWVIHCWFFYYSSVNSISDQLATLQDYIANSSDEKRKIIKIAIYNEQKGNYKEAFYQLKEAYVLDPTDLRLLDYLKDVEIKASPFLIPQHFINKIGRPVVVWLVPIVSLLLLNSVKLYTLLYSVAIFYGMFALYLWISPLLVTSYYKRKHR